MRSRNATSQPNDPSTDGADVGSDRVEQLEKERQPLLENLSLLPVPEPKEAVRADVVTGQDPVRSSRHAVAR